MIAKERLRKEKVREEYRGKLSERVRGARTRVGEGMSVNDVYGVLKVQCFQPPNSQNIRMIVLWSHETTVNNERQRASQY